MSADFQKAEYKEALPVWTLLSDVVSGQKAVKAKGEAYLPNPSTVDESDSASVYKKYKERSSFYNATGNTVTGLVGAAFRKKPTLTVASGLDFVAKDIDGSGVSIYQQSQAVLSKVLVTGRSGLLVDYPNVGRATSRADQVAGKVRSTAIHYKPEQIINWRTSKVGGIHQYSLIVIAENFEEVDEFKSESKPQIRVLKLVDSAYVVEIYRENDKKEVVLDETYTPTRGDGSAWTEIPFTFVGSENNDHRIDKSPLIDLAELNIKHYQLGADWYNALHWAGQPQPVITGLTESWNNMLEKNGYTVGSRSVLPLPENADFKFATVTADTALQAELDKIEERMKALGARLVQQGQAVKTATEAQNENESQHSVLSLIAENVSSAYQQVLLWMGVFENAQGDSDYKISQDFAEARLDAQMLTALIGLWQSGQYPESDFWNTLRQHNLIDGAKTNEAIKDELASTGPILDLE